MGFGLRSVNVLILGLVMQSAWSQSVSDGGADLQELTSIQLQMAGARALNGGDTAAAIAIAETLVERFPDDASAIVRAGDLFLRAGQIKKAVAQFDRYLQVRPQQMPGLWQRGIALYFARQYSRGVEQFEQHRIVNPHDVENAAWHFLCVAKADSFDKARSMVLPAPNDPRIPMAEVLTMLSSGDTAAVERRMKAVPPESPRHDEAQFYGHFYLGLYADAKGDVSKALEHLSIAAKSAPHHYMGDIARVYRDFLNRQKDNEGSQQRRNGDQRQTDNGGNQRDSSTTQNAPTD